MGDMAVCPNDGEPVIFSFEIPGAEYVCEVCGWAGGIFTERRVDASDALVVRHAALVVQNRERRGLQPAPERTGLAPVCGGCGKVAEPPFNGDKPAHWYCRTTAGQKHYACSRACISEGAVLPW